MRMARPRYDKKNRTSWLLCACTRFRRSENFTINSPQLLGANVPGERATGTIVCKFQNQILIRNLFFVLLKNLNTNVFEKYKMRFTWNRAHSNYTRAQCLRHSARRVKNFIADKCSYHNNPRQTVYMYVVRYQQVMSR